MKYKGLDILLLNSYTYKEYYQQIKGFNCKNESMNNYLKQSACCNHILFEENTSIVFYEDELIAYFTLKNDMIIFPSAQIAALEISRLAVDQSYQSKGVGKNIIDYIDMIAIQTNLRYITVNALLEKRIWYMNKGFNILSEEDIKQDSITVYMYKDLYDEEEVERFFDE
ncbi:GNAT family N-acetyltransferase [Bacillus cereus]|uniref:GNAT family N-acetyltransferase n=1 Tax=Bacillus cereus group TaxID=86661 RepID=UPI0011CB5EA1|nr:GNAT family N-acetyltransferase [Bacillus sp. AR18-7]TXR64550.1 GNAT family N-acetyltransferase [Bacillus sp. AR18-7]